MGVDFVYEPQVGGFFENNPTPEFDFFATASTMLTNKTLYPNGFSTAGAIQGPPAPPATLHSTFLQPCSASTSKTTGAQPLACSSI